MKKTTTRTEPQSEFGDGFVYSLFLFAKHWWRIHDMVKTYEGDMVKTYEGLEKKNPKLFKNEAYASWFNGAADHFYGLNIPPELKKKHWYKKLVGLQEKAIEWRLSMIGDNKPTKKDFDRFFKDLEYVLRRIDRSLGAKVKEAQWN